MAGTDITVANGEKILNGVRNLLHVAYVNNKIETPFFTFVIKGVFCVLIWVKFTHRISLLESPTRPLKLFYGQIYVRDTKTDSSKRNRWDSPYHISHPLSTPNFPLPPSYNNIEVGRVVL